MRHTRLFTARRDYGGCNHTPMLVRTESMVEPLASRAFPKDLVTSILTHDAAAAVAAGSVMHHCRLPSADCTRPRQLV